MGGESLQKIKKSFCWALTNEMAPKGLQLQLPPELKRFNQGWLSQNGFHQN